MWKYSDGNKEGIGLGMKTKTKMRTRTALRTNQDKRIGMNTEVMGTKTGVRTMEG